MESGERDRSGGPTTFNLLFVCTGNTCRSPMAEAVARREIEERGWRHVRVASAGVAAEPGMPAPPQARSVGQRRGLDLSMHRSQPMTPALIEWADLILVMGESHRPFVQRMGGGHKVALLGEFALGEGAEGSGGASVPDPFGGDEALYEQTLQHLSRLIGAALDRLTPIVRP